MCVVGMSQQLLPHRATQIDSVLSKDFDDVLKFNLHVRLA